MSTVPQIRGVHPSLAIVLDEIATEIREQQVLVTKAAYSAIECWMNIGKLLTEAKLKCSHGSWLLWLEASTSLSSRQAQRYMQAWSNREILIARIESGDTFDNLHFALKAICPPERKTKSVSEDAFEQSETEQTIDVTDASDLESLKEKGIEVETNQVDNLNGSPQATDVFDADEIFDEPEEKSEEAIDLPEPEDTGPPAQWLESLPLFRALRGRPLKLFSADALFWRNTKESRVNILKHFQAQQEKAEQQCGLKKCVGMFSGRCQEAMDMWHPKYWGRCPECGGTGEDVAGLCRRCEGYGYVTV